MTAIANITVKKADGTTDITFNGVGGAAGDNPAFWRCASAPGTPGQRPTLTLAGKWNAAKTVRRLDGKISFPSVYTDTSSSLTKVRSTMVMTFSIAMPQDTASADILEFAAQATNIFRDTMITGSITSGFAPT